MNPNQNHIPVLLFLIFGAAARLIPHMPNFVPVEGLTLFGAAYLKRKELAAILPVLLLYLTDLVINNTVMRPFFTGREGFIWFSNYMIYSWIAMLVIAATGVYILKKVTPGRLVTATLASSLVFFLVSNFGVWVHSTSFYTKDFNGLLTCYVAALPFLRTSMISTFLFTAILFGSYSLFTRFGTKKESSTL